MEDVDLVTAKKSVHGGEDFMNNARIDDLINEGGREVVFGTSLVEVVKVSAKLNGSLLLLNL